MSNVTKYGFTDYIKFNFDSNNNIRITTYSLPSRLKDENDIKRCDNVIDILRHKNDIINDVDDTNDNSIDNSNIIPNNVDKFGNLLYNHLPSAIQRAKTNILQICNNNNFNFFFTLTVNGEWHDRYNVPLVLKQLRKMFNNFKNRFCNDFIYILVPELHKDGAIHFHGLCYIPNIEECCTFFKIQPKKVLLKDNDGNPLLTKNGNKKYKNVYRELYNVKYFSNNLGFDSFVHLGELDEKRAFCSYISKYISKEVASNSPFKHLYFCSKGLKRDNSLTFTATTELVNFVAKLEDTPDVVSTTYDYCKCTYIKPSLNLYEYVLDNLYKRLFDAFKGVGNLYNIDLSKLRDLIKMDNILYDTSYINHNGMPDFYDYYSCYNYKLNYKKYLEEQFKISEERQKELKKQFKEQCKNNNKKIKNNY